MGVQMKFDHRQIGDLRITTFQLDKGERVPIHAHTDLPGQSHATIIVKGAVRLLGDQERPLSPGEVLDFAPGVLHGFEALEDGVAVVNIFRDTSTGGPTKLVFIGGSASGDGVVGE